MENIFDNLGEKLSLEEIERLLSKGIDLVLINKGNRYVIKSIKEFNGNIDVYYNDNDFVTVNRNNLYIESLESYIKIAEEHGFEIKHGISVDDIRITYIIINKDMKLDSSQKELLLNISKIKGRNLKLKFRIEEFIDVSTSGTLIRNSELNDFIMNLNNDCKCLIDLKYQRDTLTDGIVKYMEKVFPYNRDMYIGSKFVIEVCKEDLNDNIFKNILIPEMNGYLKLFVLNSDNIDELNIDKHFIWTDDKLLKDLQKIKVSVCTDKEESYKYEKGSNISVRSIIKKDKFSEIEKELDNDKNYQEIRKISFN